MARKYFFALGGRLVAHLVDGFLILLVAGHLLTVSLAIGGPFVAVYLRWCERMRGDEAAGVLGQWLAWGAVLGLLVGLLPGGLVLGLLWHFYPTAYFGALAQVDTSRYWLALVEWFFSLGCLVAYATWWKRMAARPVWHGLLAIVGGLNLAYHFPALFAAVALFSTRPEMWDTGLRFRDVLGEPEFLARFAHDILASFAATGVVVMGFAYRARRLGNRIDVVERATTVGGRIALGAVVLQLLVGLWLLFEVSPESRLRLLGHDLLAAGCFGGAILTTVLLLNQLVSAALGDDNLGGVHRSMIWLTVVFVLMVGARHRARLPAFERLEQTPRAARERLDKHKEKDSWHAGAEHLLAG